MLTKIYKDEFERIFSIMEQSFPKDEIRPSDKQFELLNREEYELYGEWKGAELAGFFAVWTFKGFGYIEHFAVKEEFRNGGIGAHMLRELLNTMNGKIVLEVEPPKDELTKRRVDFYERNGFKLNAYDYMQLSMGEGRKPLPLKIMSYPQAITKEEFSYMRDTIYSQVFGKSAAGEE